MGRILFFLLLAFAAYIAWKGLRRSAQREPVVPSRASTPAQAMVSCAHCGLHVPRADALPAGDRFFCCEDHRRRGPAS